MLPHKKLGSTDLMVSTLGLGTVKFGRNTDVKYPQQFNIPDDKHAADLLSLAKDCNINLLDTAPAYGSSETRLGKLLKSQRDSWVIVGKAGEDYHNQQSTYNFERNHIINSIKTSLQRLQTNYIDLLLIHSDGNDEHIINNYDVFNTLDFAKQEGLIRYSGMSTKTVAGGILALQNSDVAMVMYNPDNTEELPVIEYAYAHNKGILIKKALGSGHFSASGNTLKSSMQFVLAQPGVGSVVIGTINPQHLIANVQTVLQS